ncbi:PREDICTED: alpha-farnesene synthase-like [Ipomoea nil]|uniref:alpha-farnesene synthase-like n=1 Tax=Ipomoea nil TaxID=35883 RepID=UPI000900A9F3|nr:PREDICTED: alpha-farnesene synthase-like [Ipomoea nil]
MSGEQNLPSNPILLDSSFTNKEETHPRTANYKPTIWKYDFIVESLTSKYVDVKYQRRAEKLKEEVSCLFDKTVDALAKLELIDNIGKMGLSHHFEKEIIQSLDHILLSVNNNKCFTSQMDLYATALSFRILRQYGNHVSQDVFLTFMDDVGEFTIEEEGPKAILELFEASHLALEGEDILYKARIYCTEILKNLTSEDSDNRLVGSLLLPSHLTANWYNVRREILQRENESMSNSQLLHLAKLNFNIVQVEHQKNLVEILRWWRNLGLIENMSFTRNRVVESFLWSVGVAFEPQYGNFRKWLTKAIKLVLIVDDVYDIFGSLQELEIFTTAVEMWDPSGIEDLPECMKICFWALYDITNDTARQIHEQKGWDCALPYLQKGWADFCKALLVEAKWDSIGYTPTLWEYLDNAWISSSGSVLSLHILLGVAQDFSDIIHFLKNNKDLIYYSSLIIRLCNDQGTSAAELERGDAPSSILCYMKETGVTEEVAREHIRNVVHETWTKINKFCFNDSSSIFSSLGTLVTCVTNTARVSHFIYQNGDGFGVPDRETRDQVISYLIEPTPLN